MDQSHRNTQRSTSPDERLLADLDRNPASLAFVALAHRRIQTGSVETALDLCERGLRHHPNHSTGHLIYGLALEAASRDSEARDAFQEVVHLDPGNRIAVQHLGKLTRPAVEPPAAPPVAPSEADEDGELDFEDEVAFFTYSMAEVYEAQGFFEKALTIYQRVLTIQPDRDDVRERMDSVRRKMRPA
ncbi:MAG: tetratricopeptide repeat protein [Gemmatimonadetes bacterium]|nr:tetratricopeptide repeat protein [Gemmatimonadota bacterium]